MWTNVSLSIPNLVGPQPSVCIVNTFGIMEIEIDASVEIIEEVKEEEILSSLLQHHEAKKPKDKEYDEYVECHPRHWHQIFHQIFHYYMPC